MSLLYVDFPDGTRDYYHEVNRRLGNTYTTEAHDNCIEEIKLDIIKEDENNVIKNEGKDYTLNGDVYKISFTANDANGMAQVKIAFDLGLENTKFHFENGTIVPLSSIDFIDLAQFFITERNKFFI